MSISSTAKAVTAIAQAFLWTLLAVSIIAFAVSKGCRERLPQMAEDAQIESFGEKGVAFRKNVEDKTFQLLQENTNLRLQLASQKQNRDLNPEKAAAELLTTLQVPKSEPSNTSEFWVYVGEYDDQKNRFRASPNFDVSAPPIVNDSITAVQDVYERTSQPYRDEHGDWKLGVIRGVLSKSSHVTVLETAKIEGENEHDYNSWVKVK